MIRLGLFAKVLGVGVKILGLSVKISNDLAKILGTFIKDLRKTKSDSFNDCMIFITSTRILENIFSFDALMIKILVNHQKNDLNIEYFVVRNAKER